MPIRTLALAVIASLLAGGCSTRDSSWKSTVPLKGVVLVDGVPAEGILVKTTDVAGVDIENPTFSSAITDAEGRFSLSTYKAGDGVPAGEYDVTFTWGTFNAFSMQYDEPDKLNNRYSDPAKSEFRVRVEPGKPADMGQIQLTTK